MSIKTILLMAIIVAGSGLIFLIAVGFAWWRAIKESNYPYQEMMDEAGKKRIDHEGLQGLPGRHEETRSG